MQVYLLVFELYLDSHCANNVPFSFLMASDKCDRLDQPARYNLYLSWSFVSDQLLT
jgi:hypothetical protein